VILVSRPRIIHRRFNSKASAVNKFCRLCLKKPLDKKFGARASHPRYAVIYKHAAGGRACHLCAAEK
jgi:hypothetical protein